MKRIMGKKHGDSPNITKIIFMETFHSNVRKILWGLTDSMFKLSKKCANTQMISGNFSLYQWKSNIKIKNLSCSHCPGVCVCSSHLG